MKSVVFYVVLIIFSVITTRLVTDRSKLLRIRFLVLRKEWERELEKRESVLKVQWTSSSPVVLPIDGIPMLLKEVTISAEVAVTNEGSSSKAQITSTGFGLAMPDRIQGWKPTAFFVPEVDTPEAAVAELCKTND